jgi:hypothetical protein
VSLEDLEVSVMESLLTVLKVTAEFYGILSAAGVASAGIVQAAFQCL